MRNSSYRLIAAAMLVFWSVAACAARPADPEVTFEAAFVPAKGVAVVTITVSQTDAPQLRSLDLNAPRSRFRLQDSAEANVARDGDRVLWTLGGGQESIRFEVGVDHKRGDAFDARMTPQWIVARLEDVFPGAQARVASDTETRTRLRLEGPQGWVFETGYGRISDGGWLEIESDRRYQRPVGWFVGGQIGVRRTEVAGRQLALAAPVGAGFRRLDALAFLRIALPELVAVFPDMPSQMLVAGAPAEMWRGGLSSPNGLYLHKDRPLISENGTSTLLHELVHLSHGLNIADDADWIEEGLAEFYSIELLYRSGMTSEKRRTATHRRLQRWAESAPGALSNPSTGADTAAAVGYFESLHQELAAVGGMDRLVRELRELRGAPRVDGALIDRTVRALLD